LAIVGVLGPRAHEVGLGVASFNEGLGVGHVEGFFAEFVGTFILVFVIFGVIHTKAAPGFAGVAIGLVVFAAIIPVAPATAAAINPARVVGPMVVLQAFGGDVHWSQLPTYVLAEVAAGVAAGLSYALVSRSRPSRSVDIPANDGVLAPRTSERVA
jgi:glycerol uptake facilitator protein